MALTQVSGDMIASGQTIASPTLTSATLTSPTMTTPTINSAQIPTVSGTAPLYLCRAWVNFNGTGTVAIRASGNVSSITDYAVGSYAVNFTTAMPDADYSVSGSANDSAGSSSYVWLGTGSGAYGTILRTTTSVRIQAIYSTSLTNDSSTINVNIFR